MPDLTIKHHWWHPVIQKLAASSFGSWLLTNNLQRIDKPLLRLTKNRASFTNLLAGLPVICRVVEKNFIGGRLRDDRHGGNASGCPVFWPGW